MEEPRTLLLPAPLSPAHAGDEELRRCNSCHGSGWTAIEDDKCLECHEDIERRLADRIGYHGNLSGSCASCHRDHQPELITLDDDAFQHNLAAFFLRGAHLDVACDSCHRKDRDGPRRYLGLAHDHCTACHTDPHAPRFEQDCSSCHGESSWHVMTEAFDHDQTGFPLAGSHRGATCHDCHKKEAGADGPPLLTGTDARCVSCHDDPHGRPEADCSGCHDSSSTWSLEFDHSEDARFALDARHGSLDCQACHRGSDPLHFRTGFSPNEDGTSAFAAFDCVSCHEDVLDALRGTVLVEGMKPSPHEGEVECQACHTTEPVVATQSCSACHPADYDRLFLEWQLRVEVELLDAPPPATTWRRAGYHHWEGVVEKLRQASRAE